MSHDIHTELLSENRKSGHKLKTLIQRRNNIKMINKETRLKDADCRNDREWWWNLVNTVQNLLSSVTSKRFVEQWSNHYFLHTDEFLKCKTYWMLQTEVTNVNKTVISCYTSMFLTKRCLQKFNKHWILRSCKRAS